jgi:hypothetical protein
MDPATIGLLISIAPTILDLLFSERDQRSLFGRGSVIKHELILKNPNKKMYGYGLEGYGYRYPPLPAEFIGLPIQTKYGHYKTRSIA